MTDANHSNHSDILQSAVDARTEAERNAIARVMTDGGSAQRSEGEMSLLADVAALRVALQVDDIPADLESRLLAIPGQMPTRLTWGEWINRPIGWPHLAACAVVALAIGLGWLFIDRDNVTQSGRLDANIAAHIGDMAVLSQDAKPLPMNSTDPARAVAGLQREGLAFRPQLIRPRNPMQFAGAGITSFDNKPAVFTRWTAGKSRYTVFQFDGNCLGLPANFIQTNVPTNQPDTQIEVWPGAGGACGWALVAVDAPPGNPFINSY